MFNFRNYGNALKYHYVILSFVDCYNLRALTEKNYWIFVKYEEMEATKGLI